MADRDGNTNNEPTSDNLPAAPAGHPVPEFLDGLMADPHWRAFLQMTPEEREQRYRDEINQAVLAGRGSTPYVVAPYDGQGQLTEAQIDIGIRRTVNKLKEIRTSQGMTIAQVAGFMGVDKSVVSKFENGPADPRLSTLLRYAQAVRAAVLVHHVPELDTSILDGLGAKLRFRLSRQPSEPDAGAHPDATPTGQVPE